MHNPPVMERLLHLQQSYPNNPQATIIRVVAISERTVGQPRVVPPIVQGTDLDSLDNSQFAYVYIQKGAQTLISLRTLVDLSAP